MRFVPTFSFHCVCAKHSKILIHVLDTLPTQVLLQTKSVCHRFRNLITRIIHRRLLQAASLNDRKIILECYHPSAQYTEPYLYCDYLGTPGLNEEIQDHSPIYGGANYQAAKEKTMRKLYSHFRPTRKYPAPRIFPSHPAGDIPGSRTSEVANHYTSTAQTRIVTQNVSLEAHELFTQLHFLVAVVQTSSHRALLSVENIIDKIQRLFRNWLAERAGATKARKVKASDNVTNELSTKDNEILWVDRNKIVGLKVRVEESKGRERLPVFFQDDEDQAVSYSLDLEGKSRTGQSNGSQQHDQRLVLKILQS